jgi:hypothetical protein
MQQKYNSFSEAFFCCHKYFMTIGNHEYYSQFLLFIPPSQPSPRWEGEGSFSPLKVTEKGVDLMNKNLI